MLNHKVHSRSATLGQRRLVVAGAASVGRRAQGRGRPSTVLLAHATTLHKPHQTPCPAPAPVPASLANKPRLSYVGHAIAGEASYFGHAWAGAHRAAGSAAGANGMLGQCHMCIL